MKYYYLVDRKGKLVKGGVNHGHKNGLPKINSFHEVLEAAMQVRMPHDGCKHYGLYFVKAFENPIWI